MGGYGLTGRLFDVTETVAAKAVQEMDGSADTDRFSVARGHGRRTIDQDLSACIRQVEIAGVENTGTSGDRSFDSDGLVAVCAGIVRDLADRRSQPMRAVAARFVVPA